MKKGLLQSIFFTVLIALAAFAASNSYADTVATVKEVQGEVFIQPAGSPVETWNAIAQDTAVNNGDSVKTGNGSCLLAYSNQAEFRVQPNTSLTIQEQTDTQDINLKLGSLKAKIIKEKVIKPFQVVTPTAVAAVRGTDVDFDFNDQGQLTIDLHNDGPVQVYNDEAGMDLELPDGNKVTVQYNKETGELVVTNSCDSASTINFSILGKEYSADKCQAVTVVAGTAAGANEPPGTEDPGNEGPPNEGDPDDTPPSVSSVIEEGPL